MGRKIPLKNYGIILGIFIGAILVCLYILSWVKVKNDEKLLENYLMKTGTTNLKVNTLDELESLLRETPDDYFVFTGYRNNKEEYELEKDLKPIIDDYNLNEMLYYLDITDNINDESYIKDLSNVLDTEVNNLPTIVYFQNGKAVNKVEYNDKDYLKASDFEKLLEVYDFKKSN